MELAASLARSFIMLAETQDFLVVRKAREGAVVCHGIAWYTLVFICMYRPPWALTRLFLQCADWVQDGERNRVTSVHPYLCLRLSGTCVCPTWEYKTNDSGTWERLLRESCGFFANLIAAVTHNQCPKNGKLQPIIPFFLLSLEW